MVYQTPQDPITGEWEHLYFTRKDKTINRSLVMHGERIIGELFGDSKSGWDVVSHAQHPRLMGLRLVRGFRTRQDAAEYLLQVGVYLPDNRCVPELDHHPVTAHGTWHEDECWLGR